MLQVDFATSSGVNEAIAKFLDPREFKSEARMILPDGPELAAWQFDCKLNDCEGGWKPLDFDTDEVANNRLLEAMPASCLTHITPDRGGGKDRWDCWPDYMKMHNVVSHPDRKTAVVLAFCKWAGISAVARAK